MRRRLVWGLTLAAGLSTVFAAYLVWQDRIRQEALPMYGAVPAFELTDQAAESFSSSSLAGDVWVAAFVFTRCQGQCPLMLQALRSVAAGNPVLVAPRVVAFTVDPEFDTPEVLAGAARELGVQRPDWVFLTGERDTIYQLARRGFLLGTEATGGDQAEPILHSSRLVLVDRRGQVRGYYDALDPAQVNKLRADARRLTLATRT